MNAEIICVAVDSLPEEHSSFISSYISKKLFELGHRTIFETITSPSSQELRRLISRGIDRSDLVIVLGGLEPEVNAVAKNAAALITGIPLVTSDAALQSVQDYCSSLGIKPDTEHFAAAISLQDAQIFKNELGLCCGMAVEANAKKVLLLPSGEGELMHMFENYVAPTLASGGITVTQTVNVIGLNANEIEQKLKGLSDRSKFALTVTKRGVGYEVGVSVVAAGRKEAESACSKIVEAVVRALGRAVYAVDSRGIQFEVVSALRDKSLTVATAESCTGGMLSELLTEVGGSSKVFEYGISAYSNRIKTDVLKVPKSVIASYSAISRETAMYMAKNVREISGASIGIAITGNAGPEPSEGKSVGTVFVAIADSAYYMIKELELDAELGRDEIRENAAATALELIRRYALSYPDAMAGMIKYNDDLNASVPASSPSPEAENEAIPDTDELSYNVSLSGDEYALIFEREDENDFGIVFDRETDDEGLHDENREEFLFENEKSFALQLRDLGEKILRALRTVIPWRGDGVKRILIKSGFLLSLIALIISSSVIFTQLTADSKQRDIIAEAQQTWDFDGNKNEEDTFTAFEPFIKENEDIRGWITIPGTLVDNPIYQTTDNDYYLTHNMNKEQSRYGALFFDYRCSVSKENPTQNVTVYGHEMKDGSMFGTLKKYKNLSFYKTNPTFTVTKLSEQSTYKIFSVMIMNATAADDNGYLYNFTTPTFNTQTDFLSWIDEAYERSLINTTVDVKANDQIITLVTCINDFPDARLVIMARMTRPNESSAVSTQNAVLNPNPRYPQAWYDNKGLSGYSKTDTSSEDTHLSSSTPSHSSTPLNSSDTLSSNNSSGGITSSSQTASTEQTQSSVSSSTPASSSSPSSSAPAASSTPAASSDASDSSEAPTSSDAPESSEAPDSSEESSASELPSSSEADSSSNAITSDTTSS